MEQRFHTSSEELAELLPKNIARTPKILPKGWQLLFEETKTVKLKIPLYPEFAENKDVQSCRYSSNGSWQVKIGNLILMEVSMV